MFGMPNVDELQTVARNLGMHLGPEEAEMYHRQLRAGLEELDLFVQSRLDEEKPPVSYPERAPGCRPSAREDLFNAWVWKCRIEGSGEGALAGRTVSFKDHIAVAGVPMTIGSFALEGLIPDVDATIATRVLHAGATIVGKNTMDGLSGLSSAGRGGDYGRPRNPHCPSHLTGGSSAGSAVAVAAKEVDISFGGDQGGSIRIPAAWCGTLGLKPTFGLVSHFGISQGVEPSLDHTGPLALSVEDLAAALEATAGYDGYDPRQDRTVPEHVDALSGLDLGVSGIRIGVLEEGIAEPIDHDIRDAVTAAIDTLAQAGARIQKVSIPEHLTVMAACNAINVEGGRAMFDTGFYGAFARTYYPTLITAALNRFYQYEIDRLTSHVKLRYLIAEFSRRNYHGMVYAKAHNVRPGFIRAYDETMADVDLLAMPTCLISAPEYEGPPLGGLSEASSKAGSADTADAVTRNTFPFNYTGHPALAVPCGKRDGLPVSLQLVGRFYDDPLLLRVAYAYQHSVPWEDIVGGPPGARSRARPISTSDER